MAMDNMSASGNNSEDIDVDYPDWFYRLPQIRAIEILWKYVGPALIVIATIGNLLSLVLLSRASFRGSVTSLYLRVLAVVDTSMIYITLLNKVTGYTLNYDPSTQSAITCKIYTFLGWSLAHFEIWTVVSVSLERLVAVCFPTKSKIYFTKKRAALGLVIQGMACGMINVNHLIHATLYGLKSEQHVFLVCNVIDDAWAQYYEVYVYPKLDLIVGCIVPFSIMLISNLAIIAKLVIMKKRKSTQGHIGGTGKIRGYTLMLLGVCLIFLVTNFPIWIFLTNLRKWMIAAKKRGDIKDIADLHLHVAVVSQFYYLNFAVNFFVYVVSATRFRKELRRMLCCCRKCIGSNQIHPSGTTSNTPQTRMTNQIQPCSLTSNAPQFGTWTTYI